MLFYSTCQIKEIRTTHDSESSCTVEHDESNWDGTVGNGSSREGEGALDTTGRNSQSDEKILM
jgi:hypothetical protein